MVYFVNIVIIILKIANIISLSIYPYKKGIVFLEGGV